MRAVLASSGLRGTVSMLVVVAIFGFFFPKVADHGVAWETITAMTVSEIVPLLAVAAWNIASYWPMLTAVQPGLQRREAAVGNLASIANTIPGGGARGQIATGTRRLVGRGPIGSSWLLPLPLGVGCWIFWRGNKSWRVTPEQRDAWQRFRGDAVEDEVPTASTT
jgi:hypothetical protein